MKTQYKFYNEQTKAITIKSFAKWSAAVNFAKVNNFKIVKTAKNGQFIFEDI